MNILRLTAAFHIVRISNSVYRSANDTNVPLVVDLQSSYARQK